jgi:uncharacterized membrane protein YqgA involved in biofilm formation
MCFIKLIIIGVILMLGNMVNFFAIIIGAFVGVLLKGGIPKRVGDTVMNGLALCVLYIGISGALKTKNDLLVILSIAIGAVIGEILNIDNLFKRLGGFLEAKFSSKYGRVSEGFVSASLIYCVGAMAILGSLQSGLNGKHDILFSKSILDGVSAIVFASTLGIGVLFSAFAVLLYQGSITMFAFVLSPLLVPDIVTDMGAAGSLLIIGLGLNMLNATKIKVANMLPAVFIPIIYQLFHTLIK